MLPPSEMVRTRSAGRARSGCAATSRVSSERSMRGAGRPRSDKRRMRESRAAWGPFELREYRKGSAPREIDQQVEALCHRDREALARDRTDGMAVDCDEISGERSEIDPELARGCPVDDLKAHAPAALDGHDPRVREGPRGSE